MILQQIQQQNLQQQQMASQQPLAQLVAQGPASGQSSSSQLQLKWAERRVQPEAKPLAQIQQEEQERLAKVSLQILRNTSSHF